MKINDIKEINKDFYIIFSLIIIYLYKIFIKLLVNMLSKMLFFSNLFIISQILILIYFSFSQSFFMKEFIIFLILKWLKKACLIVKRL